MSVCLSFSVSPSLSLSRSDVRMAARGTLSSVSGLQLSARAAAANFAVCARARDGVGQGKIRARGEL